MYAYFGGATAFRVFLPYTGYLQLVVGILGELYIISQKVRSGHEELLWPNVVSMALLTAYAAPFTRDLRGEVAARKGRGKRDTRRPS